MNQVPPIMIGGYSIYIIQSFFEVFMMNNKFVVVDVETTGNAPKNGDRIIQLAIIVMQGTEIVEQFSSFVNPQKEIPPFIEQLTGISNELVQNAPTFEELADHIYSLLNDGYFVAHNVFFDFHFLQEEFKRLHYPELVNPIIDTVELARIVFPRAKGFKLKDLAEFLQIEHLNPHRADHDAFVTALLLQRIFNKLKFMPHETLKALNRLTPHFISDVEEILDAFINEKMLKISRIEYEDIIIHRQIAFKKMEWEIPSHTLPLEEGSFETFYHTFYNNVHDPMNPLSFHYQMLANKVLEAYETNQHALIEINKGIEKTVSYLLPAIFFALTQNKQITVATSSLYLMEQIKNEIVPFMERGMKRRVAVSTLKGSRNYLCLNKFERALKEDDKNYDVVITKAQVLVWLLETETGDVDELNLSSGGIRFWDRIHADAKHQRHPWRSFSYYDYALNRAKRSHIVLTNHAMLMADTCKGRKQFNESHYLVIDEAHLFERACIQNAGRKLEYSSLIYRLQRLNEFISKLKPIVLNHFEKHSLQNEEAMLREMMEQLNELFTLIHDYVKRKKKNGDMNIYRYRLQAVKEKGKRWTAIIELVQKYQFLIHDFLQSMYKQHDVFEKIKEKQILSDDLTAAFNDYFSYMEYFHELQNDFHYFFFISQHEIVTWIEIEAKGAKNAVKIFSQPISVSSYLADEFFSKKKSVILISNALTVAESFDYYMKRLGLQDFYPMTIQLLGSARDKKRMKLLIPIDFPFIQEVDEDVYTSHVATSITHIVKRINGKTVVLFSSFEMLKNTYEKIKDLMEQEGMFIFGQGINGSSPQKVIKAFEPFEKGIFLSTTSFWNSIDIPMKEIKTMIVVRLPFSSPNDPIVSANCDQLTRIGKNPFYEYSLPEAVIRLKQGIQQTLSFNENVTMFVLDKRLTSSTYRKYFLSSLEVEAMIEKPFYDLLQIALD